MANSIFRINKLVMSKTSLEISGEITRERRRRSKEARVTGGMPGEYFNLFITVSATLG